METTVTVRVDAQLKAEAEKTLERLGLTMSSAMRVFLSQVVLQQGLPFSVDLPGARLGVKDAFARSDAIMALEGFEKTAEMEALQGAVIEGRLSFGDAVRQVLDTARRTTER